MFSFLTMEANGVVGAVHPKAIPVLLTSAEEWRTWLEAPERTAGRVSSYAAIYPTPAEPPISPKFDEPLPFVPNGNLGGPHPASR